MMCRKKKYSLIAGSGLLFAIAAIFFLLREPTFGIDDASSSQPVAAIKEPARKEPDLKGDWKAAAEQNALLKNNLSWNFGGKPQTGWQIYVPLIQHLIKTESAPETEEFAAALAAWQRASKLKATGILDNDVLLRMISYWQSRRLNSSIYPEPSELLTAKEDFYDPSRAPELLQLRRDAHAAYRQMVEAALADKSLGLKSKTGYLKIISAFRSKEYQEKLRQESPQSGRAGLAVNSPHFTGRALDIYVGGDPVSTKDENRALQVETPVYKWLVKNAERFGFYPYFYEPWHWEYVPQS